MLTEAWRALQSRRAKGESGAEGTENGRQQTPNAQRRTPNCGIIKVESGQREFRIADLEMGEGLSEKLMAPAASRKSEVGGRRMAGNVISDN